MSLPLDNLDNEVRCIEVDNSSLKIIVIHTSRVWYWFSAGRLIAYGQGWWSSDRLARIRSDLTREETVWCETTLSGWRAGYVYPPDEFARRFYAETKEEEVVDNTISSMMPVLVDRRRRILRTKELTL